MLRVCGANFKFSKQHEQYTDITGAYFHDKITFLAMVVTGSLSTYEQQANALISVVTYSDGMYLDITKVVNMHPIKNVLFDFAKNNPQQL